MRRGSRSSTHHSISSTSRARLSVIAGYGASCSIGCATARGCVRSRLHSRAAPSSCTSGRRRRGRHGGWTRAKVCLRTCPLAPAAHLAERVPVRRARHEDGTTSPRSAAEGRARMRVLRMDRGPRCGWDLAPQGSLFPSGVCAVTGMECCTPCVQTGSRMVARLYHGQNYSIIRSRTLAFPLWTRDRTPAGYRSSGNRTFCASSV